MNDDGFRKPPLLLSDLVLLLTFIFPLFFSSEMNPGPPMIQKQEDMGDDRNEKRDIKPVVKTLNRVPRMSCFFFQDFRCIS